MRQPWKGRSRGQENETEGERAKACAKQVAHVLHVKSGRPDSQSFAGMVRCCCAALFAATVVLPSAFSAPLVFDATSHDFEASFKDRKSVV